MTNEDAIKWLENLKNDIGNPHYECLWHYAQAIDEICAMLKEQEAKPMIENEHGWNCPSCGMKLIGKTASGYPCDLIDLPEDEPIHFCPKCGQAVKWDG